MKPSKLNFRITRKKIKLQNGVCTYSDMECLMSYSREFSSDLIKKNLVLAVKTILVGCSTLVYLTLSAYLITNLIVYMRSISTLNVISSLSSHTSIFVTQFTTMPQTPNEPNQNLNSQTNQSELLLVLDQEPIQCETTSPCNKPVWCNSQVNKSIYNQKNEYDDFVGSIKINRSIFNDHIINSKYHLFGQFFRNLKL